jgi:hypothetical protein
MAAATRLPTAIYLRLEAGEEGAGLSPDHEVFRDAEIRLLTLGF